MFVCLTNLFGISKPAKTEEWVWGGGLCTSIFGNQLMPFCNVSAFMLLGGKAFCSLVVRSVCMDCLYLDQKELGSCNCVSVDFFPSAYLLSFPK